MQKTKNILCSLGIAFFVLIGILLNHSSYDISWYYPESVHQQEAMEKGQLYLMGPFTYNIDFDGSVVRPISFANDVRTGTIDVILVLLGGGLVWKTLQKKNS